MKCGNAEFSWATTAGKSTGEEGCWHQEKTVSPLHRLPASLREAVDFELPKWGPLWHGGGSPEKYAQGCRPQEACNNVEFWDNLTPRDFNIWNTSILIQNYFLKYIQFPEKHSTRRWGWHFKLKLKLKKGTKGGREEREFLELKNEQFKEDMNMSCPRP